MPDPPLHPNCRCTVEPITEVSVEPAEPSDSGQEDYIRGGTEKLGGIWQNNGRSVWDGPVWRKWCGQYWSGGRDVRDPQAVGPEDASPADDMDQACKNHDDCYDAAGDQYPCDRRLVEELEALPADPKTWEHPPPVGSHFSASMFRRMAIMWFRARIYKMEMENEMPVAP